MKTKLVRESLNENKIPDFKTGWEIISYMGDISEFNPYRNEDAQYDDEYYSIPAVVFQKVLGWTPKQVEAIEEELESYEGGIYWETEQSDERNERGQIITWKPIPFEDQYISIRGGA